MKYTPTLIVSLLILIAVLLPGSKVPDVNIIGFDKLVHFGMFATWAVAVRHDFHRANFRYFFSFIAGMTFSLSTEVLQVFAEGRTFDWWDVVADATGLIAGLIAAVFVLRLLKRIP